MQLAPLRISHRDQLRDNLSVCRYLCSKRNDNIEIEGKRDSVYVDFIVVVVVVVFAFLMLLLLGCCH